jgi:hypothetical protein
MNADESTDASGSLPASCSAGVRFESMLIAGIFHFYAPPALAGNGVSPHGGRIRLRSSIWSGARTAGWAGR